jgi:hypothetical protein
MLPIGNISLASRLCQAAGNLQNKDFLNILPARGAKPKEKLVYQTHIARTLLAAGKRSEAETLLGEILKDHPDDEDNRA